MTDAEIIKLYFDRSERAIEETDRVYGRYCRNVSYEILRNIQDSEEIVNDTYLKTWNSIPPKDPPSLKNFLAKIVRGLSINRLEYNNAQKRGGGQLDAVLDELEGCIPSYDEKYEDGEQIRNVIDSYLRSLPREKRRIFIRRYWYMSPISEIAEDMGVSEGKIKMILTRLRKDLKKTLEREGVTV
jgi:RNA polymerase sigma-70 factor (ECF subfamily)